MTKSKLRTLKDIKVGMKYPECEQMLSVDVETLRQAAREWIKEIIKKEDKILKDDSKTNELRNLSANWTTIDILENKRKWIKHFFNLEDE